MNTTNESNVYKDYLYDLGLLIKECALEAKQRMHRSQGEEKAYFTGELMAFYRVISLMQQEAEGLGISLSDLRLDDIDPDRDLV